MEYFALQKGKPDAQLWVRQDYCSSCYAAFTHFLVYGLSESTSCGPSFCTWVVSRECLCVHHALYNEALVYGNANE